jgi:metal-responsive CopG/Arc/MetJ family transcriptional regulator
MVRRSAFMPTTKKRINLSVDDSLYSELEEIQNLRGAPSLSSVVIELTKEALELQEDLYFSKIADERESEKEISHKAIWK